MREFRELVSTRAANDPNFRLGLFQEAVEALLAGDLETGKLLLRNYVNATIGFETLGADLEKSPKSLMRMLSARGNPRADNLLGIVAHLRAKEGVVLRVTHPSEAGVKA